VVEVKTMQWDPFKCFSLVEESIDGFASESPVIFCCSQPPESFCLALSTSSALLGISKLRPKKKKEYLLPC
jgi:hypothetical protein